jgi:hypothetical protein
MYSKCCSHPTRSLLSIRRPSSVLSSFIFKQTHRKGIDSSTSTASAQTVVCPKVLPMSTTTANTSTTKTKSHYETHSAESYDSAFFYEVGPYMKHLRDLCHQRLQLQVRDWNRTPIATTNTTNTTDTPTRILLDIGGGTGTFTRTLIANDDDDTNTKTNIEAIVVDPYLEFNSKWYTDNENSTGNKIRFIKAPAEAFIMKSTTDSEAIITTDAPPQEAFSDILQLQYHQILMKEVIHHFATNDRPAIFHGLYHHGLIPTTTTTTTSPIIPSILIITRPQQDIDYPLWDAAKTIWAQNQPSLEVLKQELETAGFTHVTHTTESYPCSIPLSRWCSMIRNRFWSTFTNFTDDELQQACQIIETNEQHRITKDGMIHFEDRLVFITACKL